MLLARALSPFCRDNPLEPFVKIFRSCGATGRCGVRLRLAGKRLRTTSTAHQLPRCSKLPCRRERGREREVGDRESAHQLLQVRVGADGLSVQDCCRSATPALAGVRPEAPGLAARTAGK